MTTSELTAGTARPVAAVGVADDRAYVDWPAVLAGAALAAAISVVLLGFGSAIGLGITSPLPGEGVSLLWFTVAAALWLLWTQVSSFMAGGYLAGRLRRRLGDATPDEVDLRDGAHGLLVWAVGTLLGATILAGGLFGAVQTAGQAAGAAAGTVAAAATGDEAPDGFATYLADTLLRGDAVAGTEATPAERAELGRIVALALARGGFEPDDRAHLAAVVAGRTGLDPAATEGRIAAVETRIETLHDEAVEAAEAARRTGVVAAFLVAASLLVSAAGAYVAAGFGGRHRDAGTLVPLWRPLG